MIINSKQNFFTYRAEAASIVLIDKKCAVSGNTMKGMKDRLPEVVAKAQIEAAKKPIKIGHVLRGDFNTFFIVGRESYHQAWNEATFEHIWKQVLPQLVRKYKYIVINVEDYPDFEEIIKRYDRDDCTIIITHHSEWGNWNYYNKEYWAA